MTAMVNHILDGFSSKSENAQKQVALYFGSFNPIHIGHLIIGNYIAQQDQIDEVWFVVSPQNPHKLKKNLLADHHRLAMVRIAVEENPHLKASDIEFKLPKPSYTTYTLQALKEKHPTYAFTLVMGEDNLRTLHKWKNYEYIIENYPIIVYPRVITEQEKIEEKNTLIDRTNIIKVEAPLMKISSSFIRKMIGEKMDVRYLLSDPVFTYLDEMNFYKK